MSAVAVQIAALPRPSISKVRACVSPRPSLVLLMAASPEIFLQNHKAGSSAGINAQDAAVVCSIALQYGVPLDVIRRALMRDPQGRASGPLGTALDMLGGAP